MDSHWSTLLNHPEISKSTSSGFPVKEICWTRHPPQAYRNWRRLLPGCCFHKSPNRRSCVRQSSNSRRAISGLPDLDSDFPAGFRLSPDSLPRRQHPIQTCLPFQALVPLWSAFIVPRRSRECYNFRYSSCRLRLLRNSTHCLLGVRAFHDFCFFDSKRT